MLLILISALAVVGVSASELNDFTNNLASDIGPLLALFGEEMTKQYLSESTKFVDYVIFALAPIGILTTLISVIRVCGDSSLRAFIGKAQEADGAIEAELCTSISRDVCELFNQAGITRVLGRPRLLELVYYHKDANSKPHMGIHIFQHDRTKPEGEWYEEEGYERKGHEGEGSRTPRAHGAAKLTKDIEIDLEATGKTDEKSPTTIIQPTTSQDATPAERLESSTAKKASLTRRPKSMAVANSNLSLNVGIRKLPPWVLYIVAAIGMTLQLGVMVMAGLATYKAGWAAEGDLAAFAHNKSPLIFISGTAAMCGGMFFCAFLIGESTREKTYYRKPLDSDSAITGPPTKTLPRSRLLWLQPGDQVIGDQSFDAYAYVEDPNKPLSDYITSRKQMDSRFPFYTWFAVVITMTGYLAQFIGVRGMSSYVSIAQFGSTVIMTFLRGLLRTRQISKKDNQLDRMPELVAGHELDWLAFYIWNGFSKYAPHVSSLTNGSPGGGSSKGDTDEKYCCPLIHVMSDKPPSRFDGEIMKDAGPVRAVSGQFEHDKESHPSLNDLTLIRARLAHLTGHFSPGMGLDGFQEWQDDQVKVRTKARQIADAICSAAAAYIPPNFFPNSLVLRLRIGKSAAGEMPISTEVVEVPLTRVGDSNSQVWTVESSKLEAILGLSVWSTKVQEIDIDCDEHGNRITNADHIPNDRIVLVNGSKFASVYRTYAKKWMDAKTRTSLKSDQMTLKNSNIPHLSKILKPADDPETRAASPNGRRFFGGNFHLDVTESQTFQIALAETTNDLITQCAHDLYSILLESLVWQTGINAGELIITQEMGFINWTTTAIVDTTKHFVATGLGSALDASLCVSSALSPFLCAKEVIAYAVMRTFVEYHKPNSSYESEMYANLSPLEWFSEKDYHEWGPYDEYTLICSFEYWRNHWDKLTWSINGRKACETSKLAHGSCKEVRDITEMYASIIDSEHKKPAEWQKQFNDGDRSGLLGYLTWRTIDADELAKFKLSLILDPTDHRAGRAALVLALLLALLRAGLDLDTYLADAVGFFAEQGNTALLRLLLDFGVHPGKPDEPDVPPLNQRPPLARAVKEGKIAAIDILLRTAKISSTLAAQPHPALACAIEENKVEALARLLAHGQIRIGTILGGKTLEIVAGAEIEVVRLFLDNPLLNSTDVQKLFRLATQLSRSDIVKLLQDDGRVNSNAIDRIPSSGDIPSSLAP